MKSIKNSILFNGVKLPVTRYDAKKKLKPGIHIPLFTIGKGKAKQPVGVVSAADLQSVRPGGFSPVYGYQLIDQFTPQYGAGKRGPYGRFKFLSSLMPRIGYGSINDWIYWGLIANIDGELSFEVDLSSSHNPGATGVSVLQLMAEPNNEAVVTIRINDQPVYLQVQFGIGFIPFMVAHTGDLAPVQIQIMLESDLNPPLNNGEYIVEFNLGSVDLYETILPPALTT